MIKLTRKFTCVIALLLFSVASIGSLSANQGSIADVATADGNFTTLLAAADAAGLAKMLDGNGPFTLLAPTDAAFAALPDGTVETLLEDPTGTLRQILLYHVLQGAVGSGDVAALETAQTALGKYIGIEVVDGNVIINGTAMVVTADIETSNGIIHVIDTLLLPPSGWGLDALAPTDTPPADPMPEPDEGGNDESLPDTPVPAPSSNAEAALLTNMLEMRRLLENMGGLLDRYNNGEAQSCGEYLNYYEALATISVIDGLSGTLPEFQEIALEARDLALETNKDVYLLCESGGGNLSPLNYGIARIGINNALRKLIPLIEALEVMIVLPNTPPDLPPLNEIPENGGNGSTPGQPSTTNPLDRNGDGTFNETDVTIATGQYVNRVDQYLDSGESPLPWNADSLYIDMFAISDLMVFVLDEIAQGECITYEVNVLFIVFAPEYANVPGEWSAAYSQYVDALNTFISANQPLFDACFEGNNITEAMIETARNGTLTALEIELDAFEMAANILDVPYPY